MTKNAQLVARRGVARQLLIAIAGFGALGAVGFADAVIGDDVDFIAIYLAIIAAVAWTSRLAVANVSAVTGLLASLGADVVAHPPDLSSSWCGTAREGSRRSSASQCSCTTRVRSATSCVLP